jgi:CheY-like chemotaxis protein
MKKILIVDDSLFMRKVLGDLLCEKYGVLEADSGQAALAMVEKEPPHLVLLDIIMPEAEEEGIRVLKALKETHPHTPVIMITAVGQSAMVEQCMELGAADYVVKPFDEQVVLQAVDKQLAATPAAADL